MAPKLVATHKYCLPVLVNGQLKYGVWRKIPGTGEVAYLSRHASIRDCCDALKKRFPAESSSFTPNKLLLKKPNLADKRAGKSERPTKRMEKILYKGVTPETRANGKVVWKVHHNYNTPKWRYDCQIEAATAIVHAEGITLADLKRKRAKLPNLKVETQQQLHGKAMALYHLRRPGDCVNADMHAKRAKTWKAMERFPGIIPSFFMAKASADRNDVVESAVELWQSRSLRASRAGSPKQHYFLFVRAARKISQRRWSKAEERSIGRNNFHWMNYHTMMLRLNILSTTRLPHDTSKPLVFQNSGTEYYVHPWNNRIKDKVQTHIAWGEGCLKLQSCLPKNAETFVECVSLIDAGQKLVGAMADNGYSRMWLKRGWMRFLVIGYDIKIDFRSLTLGKFIRCWPDEHGLMVKLLSDPNLKLHANLASPVGPGLENLEYKDEAELLSMHACLVDDWDAQTVLRQKGPGWISRNWREMRLRLDAWHRRDGIYPHPGLFFLHCWDLK